jgi:antitoxin component YwqK of YwqJK toxin-antitoxin module
MTVRTDSGVLKASRTVSFGIDYFYQNGQKKCHGHYDQGLADSCWRYYDSNSLLHAKCYYEKGKMVDSCFCYFPSGKVQRLLVQQGKQADYTLVPWHWTDYYENGQKEIESSLIEFQGEMLVSGLYQEWYPNGQLKEQAKVRIDWTEGKWRRWDEKGNLITDSQDSLKITFDGN